MFRSKLTQIFFVSLFFLNACGVGGSSNVAVSVHTTLTTLPPALSVQIHIPLISLTNIRVNFQALPQEVN